MRVTLIPPPPGPRTGSRTYADQMLRLLSGPHDVRLARGPQEVARDAGVVHLLDAKSLLGSLHALAELPAALVVDLHDDYWTGRPRYPAFDRPARALLWRRRRPRYLELLRRADAVAVHARHMLEVVPHQRKAVVPIPALSPSSLPPRAVSVSDRAPTRVLFAGRDALRKGLPVLGAALRLLRAEGIPVEARVAGGDWTHLRAAAGWWMRGVPTRFDGDLDAEAMTRAYAEADLVAVPSYTEAFGLVAQEALLHGVPVAASRVGGLEEILTPPALALLALPEGAGGILVPPGDPRALARAVQEIASDLDGWRERARAAGLALAAVRTPRAALLALETLYETALAHRRETT